MTTQNNGADPTAARSTLDPPRTPSPTPYRRPSPTPSPTRRRRLDRLDPRAGGSVRALIALAAVVAVAGALLGFAGALLAPKTWASRADILYAITKEEPTEFLREDRKLTTQVVLLTSRTVLDPVAAANGIPVEKLAAEVTARVVPGSQILEVEVRDRSPERGRAMTAQIVDNYARVATAAQPANPARDYLQAELASVRDRLAAARASSGSSAAGEVTGLAERERGLGEQLDTIAVDRLSTPRPLTVVAPYTDAAPSGPSPAVGAISGALVALLLFAGLILLASTRRRARADGR